MKNKKCEYEEHVDYKWIDKKINGHGATYSFYEVDGIVIVRWIYGKNRIQLFWYNVILFAKYLIRKMNTLLNKN